MSIYDDKIEEAKRNIDKVKGVFGDDLSRAGILKTMQEHSPEAKAQRLSRNVSALRAQRQRREGIRQQRIATARATAGAEATGTGAGSGLAGGLGGLSTRTAAGIGVGIGEEAAGIELTGYQQQIEAAQAKAAERSAKTNIFGQVIGGAVGFVATGFNPAGAVAGAKLGGSTASIFD